MVGGWWLVGYRSLRFVRAEGSPVDPSVPSVPSVPTGIP